MIVIDFTDLKRAITDCLYQTHTAHKSELDTLLTLRFQTLEKRNFRQREV